MGITKQELINNVADTVDITKKDATQIVNSVFDSISSYLADGEDVNINGFGKFTVNQTAERTGRNPKTGEPITITAKKAIRFKPSIPLKRIVNYEEGKE